jgi:hypothetical protein
MLLAIQPGDREHILRFRIIAGVCRRNSFLAVGGSDLMRNRVSIESPGRFTPTLLDGCPDFLFLHWCQIVELEAFGNSFVFPMIQSVNPVTGRHLLGLPLGPSAAGAPAAE